MSIKVVGRVHIQVQMMHGYCNKCGTVVEGPREDWKYHPDPRDPWHTTDCPQCHAEITGKTGSAPASVREKGGWQPCRD